MRSQPYFFTKRAAAGRVSAGTALAAVLFLGAGWAVDATPVTIYLVSHGWHTGIVVPRREIPEGFWRGGNDFPDAEFLEFGWGEEEFYRAEDPGFFQSFRAALFPSPAVLHVAGFQGPVTEFFASSGVVEIDLEREGFFRLAEFLDRTLVKPEHGEASAVGSGLYGDSRFYAAHGEYTLFNNCNHWVAQGLQTAGLAVDPDCAMTATAVFEQAQRIGKTLRPEP